ncbi:hypothetical protein J6590_026562 [Homalodisca vitripennis]|nr:hypothetical protein J6590_095699 [Homalodisca vitripennis]KAG8322305.1 hypothetical protein J6590_026562 [Homalodisca vitripennis]
MVVSKPEETSVRRPTNLTTGRKYLKEDSHNKLGDLLADRPRALLSKDVWYASRWHSAPTNPGVRLFSCFP